MTLIQTLQHQLGRGTFQLVVLVMLIGILLLVRLLRNGGRLEAAASLAGFGLGVSITAALALTLRPVGRHGGVLLLDPIEGAWGWDSIAWNPVIDNVALFVPIGALAVALWWRRSPVVMWLGCVAMSALIEAVQFVLPLGRVANVADLLANAFGALLGVGLALLISGRPHLSEPVRSPVRDRAVAR